MLKIRAKKLTLSKVKNAILSSGGGGAGPAVALDSIFESGTNSTATTDFSFFSPIGTVAGTVGNNTNRVLIGAVAFDHVAATVGNVTMSWAGQSMTQIATVDYAGGSVYLFGLVAPTVGDGTLFVDWDGSHFSTTYLGAISVYNADQSTPWDNAGSDTGTGTSASSIVTTTNGSMAIAVHANNNASSTTISAGSGWTATQYNTNSAEAYLAATTTSTTITVTLGSSVSWANAKVNIRKA